MKDIQAILFDAYGTLFDVGSVIKKCDEMFPEHGAQISKIWRNKQLEYTWLLSLMGRYETFFSVTRKALVFTLKYLKLPFTEKLCDEILEGYHTLKPYPEARGALESLSDVKLAILSNGNYEMLAAVVKNAGFDALIPNIISVDELKIFKPFLGVYQLGPAKLGVPKDQSLFVSANPWDIAGAKTFGFLTCWICREGQQFDELGIAPDFVVRDLNRLTYL